MIFSMVVADVLAEAKNILDDNSRNDFICRRVNPRSSQELGLFIKHNPTINDVEVLKSIHDTILVSQTKRDLRASRIGISAAIHTVVTPMVISYMDMLNMHVQTFRPYSYIDITQFTEYGEAKTIVREACRRFMEESRVNKNLPKGFLRNSLISPAEVMDIFEIALKNDFIDAIPDDLESIFVEARLSEPSQV